MDKTKVNKNQFVNELIGWEFEDLKFSFSNNFD